MTNSNPDVYKANTPGDLFALVPALFGFHPHESLVAIATHGSRHRFGFRLRMDLPDFGDAEAMAHHVAGYLRKQDPDGVVLLAISKDAEPAGALVRALLDVLDDVTIVEAARGDGEHYWSYLCDGDCCPQTGTRYGHQCSTVLAEAVFNGTEILPDREALARRFDGPTGQRRERMATVVAPIGDEIEQLTGDATDREVRELRLERLQDVIGRGLDDPAALTDVDVAVLAAWASVIPVRDQIWSMMSRESATRWLRLFTHAAGFTVPPYEPAVLCLAAFAAWLVGDGAQAHIAASMALDVDAGYTMAHLILQILESGMPPSSWTGFEPQEVTIS